MVYGHTTDAVLQAIATATVYLDLSVRVDQIGKIKAHRFMVYGHTTDAVLQAIPATAVYLDLGVV